MDHDVVSEDVVAARHKACWVDRLLQDAEDPAFGVDDRVVDDGDACAADVGNGCDGAAEDVRADEEIGRFERCIDRTEELKSGGAAEIHGTLSAVGKRVAKDSDELRAPFRLNGIAAESGEEVADDASAMTAHHIDTAAAGGTASERAVCDLEVVESGELQHIVVAGRIHRVEGDAADRDVMGRRFDRPTVINIHPVAGLCRHGHVLDAQIGTVGEVHGLRAADKAYGGAVGPAKDDRRRLRTLEVLDPKRPAVLPRHDEDGITRTRITRRQLRISIGLPRTDHQRRGLHQRGST